MADINFGAIARALRRALNVTLGEIAKAIGRHSSHVCAIERGHRSGSPADRERINKFLREREQPLPIPAAAPRRIAEKQRASPE